MERSIKAVVGSITTLQQRREMYPDTDLLSIALDMHGMFTGSSDYNEECVFNGMVILLAALKTWYPVANAFDAMVLGLISVTRDEWENHVR